MDREPDMIVVYLIGVAGVGKSTTVKELTNDWSLRMEAPKPFAHRHYTTPYGRGIVLGKDIEPFGGTDTLSWTAINHVGDFFNACAQRNVQIIIGEGDRFANARFFEMAMEHGSLLLYNLDAPDVVTDERRKKRASLFNSPIQNPTWVAGRKTKVAGLVERFETIRIDATQPTTSIIQTINKDIEALCQYKDPA
jgi:GTPase SAR1 family protein